MAQTNSEERMIVDSTTDRLRGDCYKMLAVCFYPPERKILLEEDLLGNLSASLERACPEAQACAEEMARAIRQVDDEELAVDHARLFVGPFGLKAPPYGSLYLDGDGKVMGNSTMQVIQIYEEEGLVIDDEFTELPDHVAVELEFMYYLIHKTTEIPHQNGVDPVVHRVTAQWEFLTGLILPWLEPFCGRIVQEAETSFYRALANCLLAFANKDGDYLKSLVGEGELNAPVPLREVEEKGL